MDNYHPHIITTFNFEIIQESRIKSNFRIFNEK